MTTLRKELDEAHTFLAPALEAGNDDVVVRLSNKTDTSTPSDSRRSVLRAALSHVFRIHEADIVQQKEAAPADGEGEYNEESRTTLYGLLDLIVIRGILPSLSPGVAAKHRPKPMIPSLRDATVSGEKDTELLCEIIDGLSKILENPSAGLAPLLRERILTDVLAGAGELAFCPGLAGHIHDMYEKGFVEMVDKTPISSALPLLTYLMQPTTPPWLKSQLSKQLSLIPLRPRGVRHTIEFIASSYPQPQQPADAHDVQNKGPSLPLDALTQAAKLLSAVPSSMEAVSYFTALAPQLLALLDGVEGPELGKAAALIIGSGILGKKALGAPGAIGWRLFTEPILSRINPPTEKTIKKEDTSFSASNPSSGVVPEHELRLSLNRLLTLLTSRPSPGLTKRLLSRLMLPLWSLLNYAKSHPVDRFWRDSSWKLLETFFRLGAGSEQLEALAVNLLWDGPSAWKFAPGSEGGVEVRWKGRAGADDGFNVIEQMGKVEQRLATYQEILVSSSVEDQDIGELFVRLSRRWLVPGASAAGVPKLEVTAEEDPLQSLIIAKLVMGMLEKFKDKLAADPDNMIELVKQLLDEWSESDKAKKKRAEDLRKANYAGLRNIVQQRQSKAQQDDDAPAGVDSSDVLPVALSLLNTLLSAPNFRPTTQTSSTLSAIIPTLSSLSNPEPGSDLPPSVSMTASNLTTRVSTLLNLPLPSSSSKTPSSNAPSTSNADDEKTLQTALTDLISPHPPIRASALSAITTLATAHSPALDLPQLTLLLLHTALPDPDEYVHLHAINALTALSALDPHLVAGNLLVTAFLDASETATLDTRLRIGEALGRVVADLRASPVPPSIAGPVVASIAAAATAVSSRRGDRARTARDRDRAARLAARKQRDAERAWGGDVPVDPRLLSAEDEDEDETEADARDAAALAAVVAGWADTGLEEDVRLRALALAVLAAVVEAPGSLALVPAETVGRAVDVVLGCLVVETGERHAILRRAAVLVVYGLVRAMDAVHEGDGSGVAEGAGLAAGKWEEVERVVGWVRERDGDAVVKGHAAEVLEALETWHMKKALGVKGDGSLAGQGVRMTDDLGLAGLRGLNVNVASENSRQGGGRKLVIEEVE